MKVYVKSPAGLSRAMTRVANALEEYAPTPTPNDPDSVYVVNNKPEADLVILHVIGEEGITEAAKLRAEGKKYAIIQYCMRSTQKPDTSDWLETWRHAECVWSYYDLIKLCHEDGNDSESIDPKERVDFNFYHAPLGVDTDSFRHWPSVPKKFTILTSGYVAESECVKEALESVKTVNGKMYHLGPNLFESEDNNYVTSALNIDDDTLSQMYSRSKYVAGLRRCEGFELPAAEGLLCGARPICFDKPHYRKWFGDFAVYIEEGSPDRVQEQLVAIFNGAYRPVTEDEISKAAALFNWPNIIGNFWRKTLNQDIVTPEKSRVISGISDGKKRRMLVIADAAVSSGFARGTHNILETVKDFWDVHVLGLNHFGDPHPYPYPIYPCNTIHGGDYFGLSRIAELISKIGPDCAFS